MATVAKRWVPDRRDMIWIGFDPQAGGEMKGEHPMLVLSSKSFNERTGIVIGLPMTHSEANETNPFAIKYVGAKKDVGYVLTHQPKSFDWRVRKAKTHPLGALSDGLFQRVCERLNQIIQVG